MICLRGGGRRWAAAEREGAGGYDMGVANPARLDVVCEKRKEKKRKDYAGGEQHHPHRLREGETAWAYSQRSPLTGGWQG